MFFRSSKSFSSQLSGSCRFAAKLLWFTARTSPPARVSVAEPVHGNDAAIFACAPDTAKRAQHNRDIKTFYHYQEGFSINFHIFIHKNHAHPISLRQRMRFFAKGKQKESLGADKCPGKVPSCIYCISSCSLLDGGTAAARPGSGQLNLQICQQIHRLRQRELGILQAAAQNIHLIAGSIPEIRLAQIALVELRFVQLCAL